MPAAITLTELHRRVNDLHQLPSLPAILMPVLNQLSADADEIDLQKTAQLVAHDGALTSQVLHMANSPLFGMRSRVTSLRAAALTLGVFRLRDIVTACCLMQLSPKGSDMDAAAFWEHALACALVSRNLARKVGYPDAERAYLAGLVHDLGILVNYLLIPREFAVVFKTAVREQRPLREVETEQLGFSHEVTGELLSTQWQLFDYLSEVMRRHHDPEKATLDPVLAAIVNIADLICRTSSLGYGYEENITVTLQEEPAWKIIADQSSRLRGLDMVRFTLEVESYVKEVRTLVSVLFRL
jgi:HD-like signal output (HDOD) protein